MALHLEGKPHSVKVLLDTGCSIPLLNQKTAQRLQIPLEKHRETRLVEDYTGQAVSGAGEEYTCPLILQHRKHYTQETFEISPMEAGIDVFLPFWWIAKHPPQGAWDSPEIRFTSGTCIE